MKKYFLFDGSTQHGPFTLAELETKIITPQTMIWYESLAEWKPATEIEELKTLLNNNVPASQILTPPTIKAKEEDWSKKQFYYTDSYGQQGPFTLDQLKYRPIDAGTQVWYDPLPEWTTAEKVPALKDIIAAAQKPQSSTVFNGENKERQYYYLDASNQKHGPYSLRQLSDKSINASTLIWYDPLPDWIKAGNEESLKGIVTDSPFATQSPLGSTQQKKAYYYLDAGSQKHGPFTLEQLSGRAIDANTLIWYEPLTEWVKASSDETVKNIVGQPNSVSEAKPSYYYMDTSGHQQGPFTMEQMHGKPINANTMVWYESLPQWIKAGSDESLRSLLSNGTSGVDWSKKLFYYTDSTGQKGPFTLEQLRGKPLTPATPVWYDPLPNWTTAGKVEGLKNLL